MATSLAHPTFQENSEYLALDSHELVPEMRFFQLYDAVAVAPPDTNIYGRQPKSLDSFESNNY